MRAFAFIAAAVAAVGAVKIIEEVLSILSPKEEKSNNDGTKQPIKLFESSDIPDENMLSDGKGPSGHEKIVRDTLLDHYDVRIIGDINIEKLSFCKNGAGYLLRPDIILIGTNICIEVDGEQHFDPNAFSRSLDEYNKQIENDYCKSKTLHENGCSLIRIPWNIINSKKIRWQEALFHYIEYLKKIKYPEIVLMDFGTGTYNKFREMSKSRDPTWKELNLYL